MYTKLTIDDIDPKFQKQVYVQDYTPQAKLDGVQLINVKQFIAEEGDFSEVMRFEENGELESVPGFKIAQINRTHLFPNSIKAWHVHFEQCEIWYVPPMYHLLVGLWDLRKDSPTCGKTMRVVLGEGTSKLLFIPNGVAHGSVNTSPNSIELFYFVNRKFEVTNPDEKRIHWDALGEDFWKPERD